MITNPSRKTGKDELTTEFHGFPECPRWTENSADELCENAECCKCLSALHGPWVETKIKCHHWAVSPRLTESQPALNLFSQPRKPLCKALGDVHLSSRFPNDIPKTTNSKWNTLIRNYYRPQNMVILPLWTWWFARKNTSRTQNTQLECYSEWKLIGSKSQNSLQMNKAPVFLTSVNLSFLKTYKPLHLQLLLWAVNSP